MEENKAVVHILVTPDTAKRLAERRKWKQSYNDVIWELLWIAGRKEEKEKK